MADTKITALTAIGANPIIPSTFPLPMVDLTDTSMAASGTTKKVTVNQILGAGGTATLASATITGAATVGTTLGVTGNLTASSNVYVPASTIFKVGPVAGAWAGLRFDSAKAMFLDSDTDITFRVNGGTSFSTAAFISAAGNFNPYGNVVMATSGKGIDFSATPDGSGTMTSELLNDYEEGTWTGTLTGSVSNPTTPVTATGRYTKVGRQVSVQIAFESADTSGASGNITISGIPFANSGVRAMGTAGSFTGTTFTGTLICVLNASLTSVDFQSINSNAAWTNATHNAGTNRYFWFNLTYTV